ncbi:ABC transporter permease [Fusibacter bizertensis]|uniref:ABC transporter permease n=1 Tax=Fusibacter bizertensis TaxID=1488331 RepID=A0ABT6NF38_9FIRM|nr:ABC transporter permease [Fusibacter bizertensis]MDH8679043.1 ABC transporter permease [Fusibacter bizertensis]
MSNKRLFLILKNLNYWKKSWFKSSIVMMLTAQLVILIGVMTHSLIIHSENILFKSPGFRSIMIDIDDTDNWPIVIDFLNEYKEKNPHVKSISQESWGVSININNVSELTGNKKPKNEIRYGELSTTSNQYVDERYLIEGRWFKEGEQNVIILPKILSFNAIYEEHLKLDIDYFDGSDFIGKSIELSYFSYKLLDNQLVKNKEYTDTFTVIGVYDNLKAHQLSCVGIIDNQKSIDMVETVLNDMNSPFSVVYSLMVDDEKQANETIADLQVLLKNYSVILHMRARPGSGLRMIEPFMQLVLFISLILFFLGFLLQTELVKRIILLRTNEIGTLKALGYEDKDVNLMLLMEIAIWGISTYLVTMLFSLIFVGIGQKFIIDNGSLFFRDLKLIFESRDLIFTFAMLTLLPILSCFINLKRINAIQPLDAIAEVVE